MFKRKAAKLSLDQTLALQKLSKYPTKIETIEGLAVNDFVTEQINVIKLNCFNMRFSRDRKSPIAIRDNNYYETNFDLHAERITYFPIDNPKILYSDQEYVNAAKIAHYIRNPSHPLPHVVSIDGIYLVIDGHHRVVAKILLGMKKMRALVTIMRRN